jgi:hypothetical protein
MKVKFKDGLYTWTSPGKGAKTIGGIDAPPGYEWVKMEITQYITNGCDCYPWREVFAWTPTKTISGKYVWWKKLYKRRVWAVWGSGFHMEPEVQYATTFDLLKYS